MGPPAKFCVTSCDKISWGREATEWGTRQGEIMLRLNNSIGSRQDFRRTTFILLLVYFCFAGKKICIVGKLDSS